MKKLKEEMPAFKANCEVILSEGELKTCAKQLAEAINGQARIEAELASFKAQKKSEATTIEATIQRNTLLLNTGKEFRMVECCWDYNWKEGIKRGHRKDTGEQISKDTITEEERQLDFAPKRPLSQSEKADRKRNAVLDGSI